MTSLLTRHRSLFLLRSLFSWRSEDADSGSRSSDQQSQTSPPKVGKSLFATLGKFLFFSKQNISRKSHAYLFGNNRRLYVIYNSVVDSVWSSAFLHHPRGSSASSTQLLILIPYCFRTQQSCCRLHSARSSQSVEKNAFQTPARFSVASNV